MIIYYKFSHTCYSIPSNMFLKDIWIGYESSQSSSMDVKMAKRNIEGNSIETTTPDLS